MGMSDTQKMTDVIPEIHDDRSQQSDGFVTSADRTLEEIARDATAQYRTVEEMVVSAIREAILVGIYRPGEKLPQEKLAHALGVSRIPVRAGLRKLEAEGLVVILPHKGATVRRLGADEVAEIYDLRILLETDALRSAIEQLSEPQIDELERMADGLDRLDAGDAWLELREAFTDRLFTLARRPRTADIVSRLRADVGRYWLGLKVARHDSSSHRLIVDAIRSRNPERAAEWIRSHLTEVSVELQAIMNERGDQADE